MTRHDYVADYRKIYPDAPQEVIDFLNRSERKCKYQEYDLKQDQYRVDQGQMKVTYIPKREDSLDLLLEDDDTRFVSEDSVEIMAERMEMFQNLRSGLKQLSGPERRLIFALYYKGYTEREWSKATGIPQKNN